MPSLPNHLFVSESGDLFDTRRPDWHKLPPIRAGYSTHHRTITNGRELRATIRAGGAAWPGGYTVALHMNDGEMVSIDALSRDRSALWHALWDIRNNPRGRIVGCDTYDEGPTVRCAYTNEDIASSYGDPGDDADKA